VLSGQLEAHLFGMVAAYIKISAIYSHYIKNANCTLPSTHQRQRKAKRQGHLQLYLPVNLLTAEQQLPMNLQLQHISRDKPAGGCVPDHDAMDGFSYEYEWSVASVVNFDLYHVPCWLTLNLEWVLALFWKGKEKKEKTT